MDKATIYLSEKRTKTTCGARTETELIVVNDCYLAGGSGYESTVSKSAIILPYIGDIEIRSEGKKQLIEENQAYHLQTEGQKMVSLSNPYANDVINFYEIGLPSNSFEPSEKLIDVDIQLHPNALLHITNGVLVGQYAGRKDGEYQASTPTRIFVYVIAGVFEVQNRLLHAHDALELWHTERVEFEALSNDAVIVLVDLGDFQ